MCSGGHAIDQAPQLFHHSLYQLLLVSVVLPELREDVVLLAGVFHPGQRKRQRVAQNTPLTVFTGETQT